MKIDVDRGKYVAAISGGMDSMVLLDLLSNASGLELIVAHFNHGIREDSSKDAQLVEEIAKKLRLPFELGFGQLSTKASEAAARQKRYDFLEGIRKKHQARAIITAHHQDDLLETAIINLLRGTGWRGLVAIKRNPKILRPLLRFTKDQLRRYALANHLSWREDETNQDKRYLRNRVRSEILAALTAKDRKQLLGLIENIDKNASKIEESSHDLTAAVSSGGILKRNLFKNLPSIVAGELLLTWLKNAGIEDLDRRMIMRLSVVIQNAAAGTKHEIVNGWCLELDRDTARLVKQKI